MTDFPTGFFQSKYLNPVYPYSFPDPFVLKFRGEYFAYCTDYHANGGVFGILHSRDLVNWRVAGSAINPPPFDAPCYWAPEVTYHNGKFYLYYSVGNEKLMEIRVAVSDRPDGGFVDAGKKLTTEEFAIDAHVFEDTNGERYLFYATDFLEHTHIGTGTVVDKMQDFFTLEGHPRPVTRAKYDWQVYDPNRKEKGGVRWHTVEGAFVLKRKGIYYEMFSGGNWQNITYGVSFAVTDDIKRDEEWTQFSDGEKVLPILRTVPDLIIGPGHNSAIRGVNNRELFCLYHRWTENGRVLSIDRMDFAGGGRMFILGATYTPQPAPFAPRVLDFFDRFSEENWEKISGNWRIEENQLIAEAGEKSEIVCKNSAKSFLCEVWLKAVGEEKGKFGVCLKNKNRDVFRILIDSENKQTAVVWSENDGENVQEFTLYEGFDLQVFHLLRIEIDNFSIKLSLDKNVVRFEKTVENTANQIALIAENAGAAFSGFALTNGFEELFENSEIEQKGWEKISGDGDFLIENRNLIVSSENEIVICKEIQEGDYEFAVNARLEKSFGEDSFFGFFPAFDKEKETPFFSVENTKGRWILNIKNAGEAEQIKLPENFSAENFHQFRFLKIAGKIIILYESETLGIIKAAAHPTNIALSVRNGVAAFDMVRLTAI